MHNAACTNVVQGPEARVSCVTTRVPTQHMCRVHGSYTGLDHEMLSHRTAPFTMPETTFCLHDTDFESIGTGVFVTSQQCSQGRQQVTYRWRLFMQSK